MIGWPGVLALGLETVEAIMRRATCLILTAGLALAGAPAGAEVFGPNTVWGSVPPGLSDAANAVILDASGRTLTMVPVIDGKFAFRDVGPGQYTVVLQTSSAHEIARSLPVDLATGSEVEAVFGSARVPAAVVPSGAASPAATGPAAATAGGGLSTTSWIVIGAAAVGLTTAVVIATNNNENVASPTR
jgi:hypothetical protein